MKLSALGSSLIALLALSGCGPLEDMVVIPIRYAPVTRISGTTAKPAASQSQPADFDLAGCWEHRPGKELPLRRRWYAPISTALFNFFHGEVQTAGRISTKVTERTKSSFGPDYLLVWSSSTTPGSRREAFSYSSESKTLTVDDKAYQKLTDADSEDKCLPNQE